MASCGGRPPSAGLGAGFCTALRAEACAGVAAGAAAGLEGGLGAGSCAATAVLAGDWAAAKVDHARHATDAISNARIFTAHPRAESPSLGDDIARLRRGWGGQPAASAANESTSFSVVANEVTRRASTSPGFITIPAGRPWGSRA